MSAKKFQGNRKLYTLWTTTKEKQKKTQNNIMMQIKCILSDKEMKRAQNVYLSCFSFCCCCCCCAIWFDTIGIRPYFSCCQFKNAKKQSAQNLQELCAGKINVKMWLFRNDLIMRNIVAASKWSYQCGLLSFIPIHSNGRLNFSLLLDF